MIGKWTKRPVTIEAVVWDGYNFYELSEWSDDEITICADGEHLSIITLEGTMTAKIGDVIIRGVDGEFYPCNPDIFAKSYVKAAE